MTRNGAISTILAVVAVFASDPLAAQAPPETPEERPRTAEQALQDGELALRIGQIADAERQFLKALVLDPSYWPAYAVVGEFYAQSQRDCARADPLFEVYLDNSPHNGRTRQDVLEMSLACRIQSEDWARAIEGAEALRAFHRGRSDHASARSALRRRAQIELRSGKPELALKTAQRVVMNDYQNIAAHLLRARVQVALGQYQEALSNYIFIDETFDRVSFLDLEMGVAQVLAGRFTDGLVSLKRSIHLDGEVAETWRWMAQAHSELKDFVSAERAYRRCLALVFDDRSPTALSSRNNLAWLLITTSRPGDPRLLEGLRLAQLAVEATHGSESTYIDTVAEALLRLGRPAEAAVWARRALRLDPDSTYLRRQLRRFERYGTGFESGGGRVRLDRWTDD